MNLSFAEYFSRFLLVAPAENGFWRRLVPVHPLGFDLDRTSM